MPKIINLKPDDEITSVIEQLWETGASKVYFVLPKKAAFLRNIIGLKLLKREAERLDKNIVLITKDDVGREMAKRAGLVARVTMPKSADEDKEEETEEASEQPEEKPAKEEVLREPASASYESFLEEEVRLRRERAMRQAPSISDIKISRSYPQPNFAPKVAEELPEEEKEEKPAEESKSFFSKLFVERGQDDLDSFLARPLESEEDFAPTEEAAITERDILEEEEPRPLKTKKTPAQFFSIKFFSFFIAGAFLVAAAALYFILPKAEIEIVPRGEVISQDFSVSVDKVITRPDSAQNKIPAQLIRLDKVQSESFPATGQRQLNEKAGGVITIYNEFSSSPQALVEKTRFVSEGGKIFRITESVTVPGARIEGGQIIASSINAEVVADQPGEDYNIGPSRFTIPGFKGGPKYEGFYGISKNSMGGGAAGMMTVVSQDDFDRAKATLWQKLEPLLDQEIKAQIPSGLKLLDEALQEEIGSAESSVAVGARGDNFTLSMKGVAAVLLFDEKDIFGLAAQKVAANVDENKSVDEEASQIEYREVKADFSRGQLNFKAKVIERLIWKVETENLKRLIAGKEESEIKEIFNGRPEIEKARVLFWPFWVKKVPANLDKIKISLSKEY